MRCDDIQLALSARLDGEVTSLPEASARAHLDGCATCRAWFAGAEQVTSMARTWPTSVPELTAKILAAVHADGHLSPIRAGLASRQRAPMRIVLAALAIVQLLLAVPVLLGDAGVHAHVGREAAAFTIAMAVGLLLAAAYSDHARTFAPVAVTLVLCLAAASALDVVTGIVSAEQVAIHAVAGVQAGLVWCLAVGSRPGPHARRPARV